MLPLVIIAGGLASRLYPTTQKIPKSLIEVAGQPFIHYQLALLKEKGVQDVVLCVGHLGSMIEEYVGDGSHWGLEVRYSYDGENLLGTGGAIKQAAPMLPDTFMILYGDSYLDINYSEVVQQFYDENLPVLMTIYCNDDSFDTRNIIIENDRIIRYDKKNRDPTMKYIDYGLVIVQKKVFDQYPCDIPFDLSQVLSDCVNAGMVSVFEVTQRFFEIGSLQGIRETEDYIRNRPIT
jgi:NDP-sugar pyrophosphorylase family protein